MSNNFVPGVGLRTLMNLSFHRRCIPKLIRSFMRSYLDETLVKTSLTEKGGGETEQLIKYD